MYEGGATSGEVQSVRTVVPISLCEQGAASAIFVVNAEHKIKKGIHGTRGKGTDTGGAGEANECSIFATRRQYSGECGRDQKSSASKVGQVEDAEDAG